MIKSWVRPCMRPVATAAATVATQASPGSAGEDLLEAVSINQWTAAIRRKLRQGWAGRRNRSPKERGSPVAHTPGEASPVAMRGRCWWRQQDPQQATAPRATQSLARPQRLRRAGGAQDRVPVARRLWGRGEAVVDHLLIAAIEPAELHGAPHGGLAGEEGMSSSREGGSGRHGDGCPIVHPSYLLDGGLPGGAGTPPHDDCIAGGGDPLPDLHTRRRRRRWPAHHRSTRNRATGPLKL